MLTHRDFVRASVNKLKALKLRCLSDYTCGGAVQPRCLLFPFSAVRIRLNGTDLSPVVPSVGSEATSTDIGLQSGSIGPTAISGLGSEKKKSNEIKERQVLAGSCIEFD